MLYRDMSIIYDLHNANFISNFVWYLASSIDKVPKVTSPVLVIHGTEDEVIDFSHGLAIYERCPRAVEPLWVEVCLKLVHYYFSLPFSSFHIFHLS
jgi:fermentation-respiration switch protein FrsA (DUF1100 family)